MTTPAGLVHALRGWPALLDRIARSASRMTDADSAQERPGADEDAPREDGGDGDEGGEPD